MNAPHQDMEVIVDTGVPGLFLVKQFLSEEEEQTLAELIDAGSWKMNRSNTRRVQMYGPWHDSKYQVKKGCIVTPLPSFAAPLAQKIKQVTEDHFPQFDLTDYHMGEDKYTELFINEYKPEDSLQFHFDHRSTYKEVIFGVSLLSDAYLFFSRGKTQAKVAIPRRSLYLMTGPSRTAWKHGMLPGTLSNDGAKRYSLTFRHVNYC
ncbi:hypothetical protein QOT17_021412 [Balamuthia mandrillaris]